MKLNIIQGITTLHNALIFLIEKKKRAATCGEIKLSREIKISNMEDKLIASTEHR